MPRPRSTRAHGTYQHMLLPSGPSTSSVHPSLVGHESPPQKGQVESMESKNLHARSDNPVIYGTIDMKQEPNRRPRRRIIRTYLLAITCVFLLNIYIFPPLFSHIRRWFASKDPPPQDGSNPVIPQPTTNNTLVPLEAHIMSKCPDARDCLVDLIVPAMQEVEHEVDFQLSFIGSMGSDDNVHCMHGPDECLGNIISLCAQQVFPKDAKRSLGFSTCMIRDYQEIPQRELVEHCSLEHGISFDDINQCASDEGRGTGLLEDSIKRSQEVEVTKSCTVRLADQIWCIRDGGEWKDCPFGSKPADLVQAVRKISAKT